MSRKGKREPPLKCDYEGQKQFLRPTGGLPQVFGAPWFAVVVLVAAVLASYANSLHCPLIFDDRADIVDNPTIRHLWPLGEVFLFRTENSVRLQARPVANLSFALDYAVGGLNPLPYHVTNLAIHLLAGLALFGVVRRTLLLPSFRDRLGRASTALALAAALLWAVHPLQTESVTYIVQRYESLMGLFYLAAMYGLIRCGDSTYRYFWGAVAIAATLLALGSKEVAISLPIMILLYDRLLLSGSFAELWRRRWGMYLALLAVWAAFAVLQLQTGPRPWAGYGLRLSWFEYARSQPGVILHYLRLAFWPHPLILDYGWPPARTIGDILPGAIVVAALLAASGYALWRCSAWGLLGAWFFLILAPTSSVMPVADLAVEHRMYLPLAAVLSGVVAVAYEAGQWLVRRGTTTPAAMRMLGPCLVVFAGTALAIVTFQRNATYHSAVSIWQDTMAKVPGNPRVHGNLGLALVDCGQFDEAIVQYRKALEIDRAYERAHNNLGIVLAGRGEVDEAIAHFRKALEVHPKYAEAHNNLGLALARRGQIDAAIAEYRTALEIKPEYADAHNNLGLAQARCGQFDEAVAHYRTALGIRPDNGSIHFNLGLVLARQGQLAEALAQYQTALDLATAGNDKTLADASRARIKLLGSVAPDGNGH